jgi:nucleoside-diphosphate kinase
MGKVLQDVLNEGFEISCLQVFNLDRQTSEEFYEVYKNVIPEFSLMANALA